MANVISKSCRNSIRCLHQRFPNRGQRTPRGPRTRNRVNINPNAIFVMLFIVVCRRNYSNAAFTCLARFSRVQLRKTVGGRGPRNRLRTPTRSGARTMIALRAKTSELFRSASERFPAGKIADDRCSGDNTGNEGNDSVPAQNKKTLTRFVYGRRTR